MTIDQLTAALQAGFGTSARVRAHRPERLYQVEVPAFLADGDAAVVYVRPEEDGRVRVTDLGHTCMRLSYTRKLTKRTDAVIDDLADRYGFEFRDGEVTAVVRMDELLAGAMSLAQIEASAEAAVSAARAHRMSTARFKRLVRELLEDVFKADVHFDFVTPDDRDALFAVDALVRTPHQLAVSFVPSDLEAEHAVNTHLRVAPYLASQRRTRWIAIPRDLDALRESSRRRLLATHVPAAPAFDDAMIPLVRERLTDLGEVVH